MDQQEIQKQAERWFELVGRVNSLQQQVSWATQKDTDLEHRLNKKFDELNVLIEHIRREDLSTMLELIGSKLDKTTFNDFKTDLFTPLKSTVEAINHFKTRMLFLGTILAFVIPAIMAILVKKLGL